MTTPNDQSEITTPQDRIQPNEPDKANPVEVSPLELILEIRGLRTQLAAAQRERDSEHELLQMANQRADHVAAERDQLHAEVARLTEKLRGKNIVITEKNAELVSIASQVAELQRDRERLEKLVPFFLRVDEDTCRASIHMGTLAVTFKEGDTLRSAIDAMRAKGEA